MQITYLVEYCNTYSSDVHFHLKHTTLFYSNYCSVSYISYFKYIQIQNTCMCLQHTRTNLIAGEVSLHRLSNNAPGPYPGPGTLEMSMELAGFSNKILPVLRIFAGK